MARHKTTLAPFTRSPGKCEQLQTREKVLRPQHIHIKRTLACHTLAYACLVNHMGIIKEILNLKYLFRNTDNIQYVD